jgi:hypothetical protein
MVDEQLVLLRVVGQIGGWVAFPEIDALRTLPRHAEDYVPPLVAAGLIDLTVDERHMRLTGSGLRRVTSAIERSSLAAA